MPNLGLNLKVGITLLLDYTKDSLHTDSEASYREIPASNAPWQWILR